MSAIRSGFRVSEEQNYFGIQGKKPLEMASSSMISKGLVGNNSKSKTLADFYPNNKRPQSMPTGLASVYYAPTFFGAAASPPEWNYGAQVVGSKTRFKLWAPAAKDVDLVILKPSTPNASNPSISLQDALNQRIQESIPLPKDEKGNFFLEKNDVGAGTLYMYRLHRHDGTTSQLLPDLRTRFQPEDVHGPSEVIKMAPMKSYPPEMITLDKRKASVYHIHTGTFTEEGNFEGIILKIGYIKDMGYTHVKLMPVDEFPGAHNWGYDGVHKFAPENAYGRPKQLQRLSEELKKHNLGLILDGVFNHIGPEGNYFRQYDPNYIEAHPVSSEWGDQLNWENPQVVDYVLKVLEMFLKEYQVDGFRFDMSSRIPDHALRTMTTHINKINPNAMIFAEDDRNSNHVTLPTSHGGLGFWGKHNFAWHHRVKGLATGQPHMNAPTDPWSLSWLLEEGFPGPGNKMNSLHDSVNFFESHDEIGNHDGLRTNTKIPRNKFIVGSLLKFVVPGIPWTFQGEETYNPSPFYYFVSHTDPDVIKGTRNGRRYSPQPDCMRPENFTDSKIKWDKADPGVTQLNKAMNHLRKTYPSLWQGDQKEMQIDRSYLNSGVLVIRRMGRENPEDKTVIVINLSDYNYRKNYNIRFSEVTPLNGSEGQPLRRFFTNTSSADWEGSWEEVLNTESTAYGGNGWVNQGKEFKNQGDINLPAWSIAVFHKK